MRSLSFGYFVSAVVEIENVKSFWVILWMQRRNSFVSRNILKSNFCVIQAFSRPWHQSWRQRDYQMRLRNSFAQITYLFIYQEAHTGHRYNMTKIENSVKGKMNRKEKTSDAEIGTKVSRTGRSWGGFAGYGWRSFFIINVLFSCAQNLFCCWRFSKRRVADASSIERNNLS